MDQPVPELENEGFTGSRFGRYLHRLLPAEPPPAKLAADVFPCDFAPGHRLIIREAAEPVAEAVVGVGADRTATVYWIETLPTHRRHGLGHKLLARALALLAEQASCGPTSAAPRATRSGRVNPEASFRR